MHAPAFARVWPIVILLALLPASRAQATSSGGPHRDYSIQIRGHRFEPQAMPPVEQGGSRMDEASSEPTPRIVQFYGPLTREQTSLLKERFGLRLDDYVPHYAFLEWLTAAQIRALRGLDFFRWSGSYEPRFKLDPGIGRHTFLTEERRAEPGILLTVVAFPQTDLERLAERVRGLGFEVVSTTDEPEHGIRRLQVRVERPEDAEAIARFTAVKYIEEVGEVTLNEPRCPEPGRD